MRKLVLFAGLPGSGKSTICQRISEATGAPHVDVDIYKKIRTDPNKVGKDVDPPELRLLYCRDALNVAFGHFDNGASTVVMDDVYPYHSVRAELESQCREQQVNVLWVEVRSSNATATERLTTREHSILSPEEALEIHGMCGDAFEAFPADSQNHIVINNEKGTQIDSLVAKVREHF